LPADTRDQRNGPRNHHRHEQPDARHCPSSTNPAARDRTRAASRYRTAAARCRPSPRRRGTRTTTPSFVDAGRCPQLQRECSRVVRLRAKVPRSVSKGSNTTYAPCRAGGVPPRARGHGSSGGRRRPLTTHGSTRPECSFERSGLVASNDITLGTTGPSPPRMRGAHSQHGRNFGSRHPAPVRHGPRA